MKRSAFPRQNKQIVLYVPTIHAGNEALVERHRDADELLVLDQSFARICSQVGRDKLALKPAAAARYLSGMFGIPARVVGLRNFPQAITAKQLVLAEEAISRQLVTAYGLGGHHQIMWEPTFLLHDRPWSRPQPPDNPDAARTSDSRDREFMRLAAAQATRSSDWWRRVGAVAVRGDEVVLEAYNHHGPSGYSPYINGDPRDSFSRGVRPDLTSAIHAEAALVATAAQSGVSLSGARLYVTTFPCPPCAGLIAAAGFSHCYYAGPYSLSDGEDILRQAAIELVWVDMTPLP